MAYEREHPRHKGVQHSYGVEYQELGYERHHGWHDEHRQRDREQFYLILDVDASG
jgi:hypothetical protein